MKTLIQPKTLEALNYFIDEEIKTAQENYEGSKGDVASSWFYDGVIDGLKSAKIWINSEWTKDSD